MMGIRKDLEAFHSNVSSLRFGVGTVYTITTELRKTMCM
jgi:hypothetical protein